MAQLSPLAASGSAPLQAQNVLPTRPLAAPTPSPYGATVDQDAIDAAKVDSRHAELDTRLALLAAGHGAQSAWNFAVGDDLKVAADTHQSFGSRVFHGGLIAANALGPEELGLKSVGKGVFVAAEHAADFIAGRAPKTVGKLIIHEGAKPTSAEMDIAAKLVHEGKTVETLSTSSEKGVRTADFKVNGLKTELKTVSHLTTKDVTDRMKDIIRDASGQARNVIVDVRKQAGFNERDAEYTNSRVSGSPWREDVDSVRFIGQGFDRTF